MYIHVSVSIYTHTQLPICSNSSPRTPHTCTTCTLYIYKAMPGRQSSAIQCTQAPMPSGGSHKCINESTHAKSAQAINISHVVQWK